MHKLTKREFRGAIHKGQGRALMHVRAHGDTGVREIILEACLQGKPHMSYSEPSRHAWHRRIVEASGEPDYYINEVITALEKRVADVDLDELCGLAAEFARVGNQRSRVALERAFGEKGLGQFAIVDLDGLDGLIRVARSYGKPGFEIDSLPLVARAECEHGEKTVESALEKAAAENGAARRFLDELRKQRGKFGERPPAMTLPEVLAAIEECREDVAELRAWGWSASEEDFNAILDRLHTEQRPEQARRLLWVIGRREVPGVLDDVIRFATSDDALLRREAFRVLGRIRNRRCREFAIRELNERGREAAVDGAIRLLIRNYRAGDRKLIAGAIAGPLEVDEIHSIGLDLLSQRGTKLERERIDLLLWIYENGPCGFCRHSVVRRLVKLKQAPEWLLEEWRFDANSEIERNLARRTKSRRPRKTPRSTI